MLQQTFSHLPGIGATTEQRLWRAGLCDWRALAERGGKALRGARAEEARRAAEESLVRFERGDWRWFDALLPTDAKWRAFGELGSRALYVDIETDGGFGADAITVIGCYDGTTAHTFVAGRDLDAAREKIRAARQSLHAVAQEKQQAVNHAAEVNQQIQSLDEKGGQLKEAVDKAREAFDQAQGRVQEALGE